MRSEAQPRLHSLPRRHLRLDGVTLSVGAAPTRGKGGRTPRGDRLSQRDTNGARVCRSVGVLAATLAPMAGKAN